MSRSSFKLPYLHRSLYQNVILKKKESNYKVNVSESLIVKKKIDGCYFFFKRNSNINENLIGKKIAVYNGKTFIIYNVTEDSYGFKLGEFSVTRQKPKHAGKVKHKKKVEKKNKLGPGEIAGSIRMTIRKPKGHKIKKGTLKKKKNRSGKKYR